MKSKTKAPDRRPRESASIQLTADECNKVYDLMEGVDPLPSFSSMVASCFAHGLFVKTDAKRSKRPPRNGKAGA
jgi:hypothetical protein